MMRVSWLVSLVLLTCLGLSGTVGATTTSVAQTASHNHEFFLGDASGKGAPLVGTSNLRWGNYGTYATGNSQSHTHSLAASTGTASSLSPYYALAYVMRIA